MQDQNIMQEQIEEWIEPENKKKIVNSTLKSGTNCKQPHPAPCKKHKKTVKIDADQNASITTQICANPVWNSEVLQCEMI